MNGRGPLVVLGYTVDFNVMYLLGACLRAGVPTRFVDLGDVLRQGSWHVAGDGGTAQVWDKDGVVDLAKAAGVFWRPVRPFGPGTTALWRRWDELMDALDGWLNGTPGRPPVVNPAHSHRHNRSRPLHESMLRGWGFDIPDSVTSADPAVLRAFLADGRAVRKSITGRHCHVAEIGLDDLDGGRPVTVPWHLQRKVEGIDVRVHVVDDRCFPLMVLHRGTDYHRSGLAAAELQSMNLPDALATQLVAATSAQGLVLAGWDLRRDPSGRFWCFECNPMPAFAAFDRGAGRQVARAMIEILTGAPPRQLVPASALQSSRGARLAVAAPGADR